MNVPQLAIPLHELFGMRFGDKALHAAIGQSDMTVNGATQHYAHRFVPRFIAQQRSEVLIRTIGRPKIAKVGSGLMGGIARTNEYLWSAQLVARDQKVWRISILIIQRPDAQRQTDLLEIIDAVDRVRSLLNFLQILFFLRRKIGGE